MVKKLFILVMFCKVFAFSETIILKDGVRIEGEFEGLVEDVYMVRTKYGVLNIKKDDILSPDEIKIKTEKETTPQGINPSEIMPPDMIEKTYFLKVFQDTDSIKKIYYENEVIIATQTFNLKNELLSLEGKIKDGKYFEYYENGKIKAERNFLNGKEEGVAKFYYPSGNLQSKVEYSSGVLNGLVYIYSESGRLLFEQNYKDGVLEGISKEYDESGNVKREILYSGGKEYIPAETVKKENIPARENLEEKEPLSLITAKKIEVARGEKYIIYSGKNLKATVIVDKNYNLISKSGKFPDGTLIIKNKDGHIEKEFQFENDSINFLKIYNPDGSLKETYKYQGEKALKQ